ncbi:hypothetical protein AAFF_G00374380 [Aldrovandia affinis]|uniref:Uncharacterized protein n=1 Tax=Aldrovandia affinis TaxID=143900 RepID=A0AAD7SGI1_9TELE|nr:hypothetical protein AAFF_G00374380 [Aldrovandia affinis]
MPLLRCPAEALAQRGLCTPIGSVAGTPRRGRCAITLRGCSPAGPTETLHRGSGFDLPRRVLSACQRDSTQLRCGRAAVRTEVADLLLKGDPRLVALRWREAFNVTSERSDAAGISVVSREREVFS